MTHAPDEATRRTLGVLIVAHGSHVNPHSAESALGHAARLRAHADIDQVGVAFWKEDAPLHRGLDLMVTDDVIVAPLFISHGYFTRTVVPREVALPADGQPIVRRGQRVALAAPIGTHPDMDEALTAHARALLSPSIDPAHVHVMIAGHGTERDARSAKAITEMVARFQERGAFASTCAAFLDEAPTIDEAIEEFGDQDVLVLPMFAADGLHTRLDIPQALGIPSIEDTTRREGPNTGRNGTRIWYASAVGALATVTDLIRSRVEQARARLDTPLAPSEPDAARARRDAIQWLDDHVSAPLQIGQLVAFREDTHSFVLRHVDDADAETWETCQTLDDLRARARRRAPGTEGPPHRPLCSERSLDRGWRWRGETREALADAIEAVYPLALADSVSHDDEAIMDLEAFASAQTGRMARLHGAMQGTSGAAIARAVIPPLCESACWRQRQWSAPGCPPSEARGAGDLWWPCRRPCHLALSRLVSAIT